MRSHVVFKRPQVFLCLCVLGTGFAQQPAPPLPQPGPPAQTQPPAAGTKTAPAAEQQPDTSDGQASISLFDWLTPSHPYMQTGRSAATGVVANLTYPSQAAKQSPGLILSFPVGKNNTLRMSYFRTQGHGNTSPTETLNIFGGTFNPGDYLSVGYTLQNAKISLDYLSWPFPIKGNLRVKTLWEVQYTTIKTTLDAPLAPTTDSSGNAVQTTGTGSNWFIYPSLGMGLEYFISKHFRWEASGSGFAFPHRSAIWDAETLLAYRSGQFEIIFGAKGFHFKTSPKRDEFVHDTLAGGFVGVRYYPKF